MRGDIEAFAGLFERYRPSLHALCLKQLGDPSLAEDVVQEVFIKAFRNLSKFDRSKLFWPWLSTMAFRMCIDLQRRRSFTHYSGDIGSSVDADESNGTSNKEAGSALDAVIASEERAEFWESLAVLTKGQRRAFVLYAVDGWSCADIASAEGISVDAVKHLLFRARRKMRAARQHGLPALVVFPSTWLRSRLQEAEERIRMFLGLVGERLSGAGTAAVSLGVLAVITGTVSHPVESFEGDGVIRSEEPALSITQTQPSQTASSNPAVVARTKVPAESQQSAEGPASSVVEDVIHPNQSATPETSVLQSMTASPSYENDHTILAVGMHKGRSVLFVSDDGGGTWKPRASRLLNGYTVVLPPDFSHDGRIFTFGYQGLQQSDDGGEIFRTVSPIWGGGVAISPSFGSGEPKVLMASGNIFEYDAETAITQPKLIISPQWGGFSHIAFSPGYPSDSTFFVSEQRSTFYRCQGLICNQIEFPYAGQPILRLSPRCDEYGLIHVLTPWKLLVSKDGAKTFGEVHFPLELQPPFTHSRSILDVAILCNRSSDPAIFASFNDDSSFVPQLPSGIYRSFDAGRSWSRTSIDLLGFGGGYAKKLIVTPTGRVLATGVYNGIACSEDGGETWAPRCPPEP